jgi:chitinase
MTATTPSPSPQPITAAAHSSKAPLVILAIFLVVMAVLGYEMMQFKRAGKKTTGVDVSVIPAQLTLKPGESHLIEATVLGTENTDVGWMIQEGSSGGSVVPNGATAYDGHVFSAGKYTAPATPGTYHVIVNSKADESRASSATITVTR